MKRPGLSRRLLSATLFLATSAGAGTTPATEDRPATVPPSVSVVPDPSRSADLLERFYHQEGGDREGPKPGETRKPMTREATRLPPDLPALSPKAPETLRDRMLGMFDVNNDGRLDEQERAAAEKYAAERGLTLGEDQRAALLQRFDTNGNGRIDEDEREALQAFWRERMGPGAAVAAPPSHPADELEKALRATVESQVGLRGRFDLDQDGRLSEDEWASARLRIARILTAPEDEKRRQQEVAAELVRRRQAQEEALARTTAPAK